MTKLCLAVLGVLVSAPGLAQDACPVAGADAETLTAAITRAESCSEAADLARKCAAGTTLDVAMTSDVIQRCEKDFANITRSERAMYTQLTNRCEKKYAKEQGTMYRAAAAFCRMGVAVTFSSVYGPIPR
jgi:hypothetical protein